MIKYHEPELIGTKALLGEEGDEHREPVLQAGDQVACIDTGGRLTLATALVDENYCSIDWITLLNTPAHTTEVWGTPVPTGNVALQLGERDWRVLVVPQIMARRRIS